MDIGIIIILFANIGVISTAEWGIPVFSKPENFQCTLSENKKEDCPFWILQDAADTVYIKFEEEQANPILISFIHCKDCGDGPKIGTFDTGSSSLLDAEIQKVEDGKYSLIIKSRLDYEKEDQRNFKFNIYLEGAKGKKTVAIEVQDIDDNPPRITVNDIPCEIPENYAGKTNCTYSIYDPDTVHSVNLIVFKFPDNVDMFFEMKLQNPNDDDHNTIAYLYVKADKTLDFEKMPMYYFELQAIDGAGNPGKEFVTIKVKDENDEPPAWINIFAMQSFEENTKKIFTVSAKDGDYEVNDIITFDLDCDTFNKSITIVPSKYKNDKSEYEANIIVSEIDRDVPEVEDHDNTIKCTIYAYDPLFNTSQKINFIIQDLNDNKPIITLDPKQQIPVELREEEYTTLDKIFLVADIDQGNNAQFDITLENKEGAIKKFDYTRPFQVIPNNGYRNWNFSLSVTEPKLLDYDKSEDWREFSLKISSKDKGDVPQHDNQIIDIKLKNLNDEIPVFDSSINYEMSIEETAKTDAFIFNVFAEDVDVGDYVDYTVSDEGKDFKLDRQTNNSVTIYTSRENVFDYEKIKVVYIQISAKDSLQIEDEEDNFHTTTQQLKINVIDVNDEKPILTLPYETPNIDEHKNVGTVVTSTITAVDVDTTAFLNFSIDWKKCRASKLGVTVDPSDFKDVFVLETKFPEENQKGHANGILKVNNKKMLDYEVFDTIFLNIQVTDLNQKVGIGIDEGIMTILLNDINDNAPQFNDKTITSKKTVTEQSKSDVKIATIIATDIDGPGNNNISYFINPVKKTKTGLIKINKETGELTVDENEKIDADAPDYIKYLYYEVIASDIVHNTRAEIQIVVEDINNKKPFLLKPLYNNCKIKETISNTNQFIQKIHGFDNDRDDPHSNVTYYLNNEITPLKDKYKIDIITGEVFAVGKIEWAINHKEETIYAYLEDNFNQRDPNIEKINFTVTITDIDNNPPVLPKTINILAPPIKENIALNEKIASIIATDNDEPCTDRTEIHYSIVKIEDEKGREENELFKIDNEQNSSPTCEQIGNLRVNKSLDGYSGKITITIRAQSTLTNDHYDEHDYDIDVVAFNFKPPKILYPSEKESSIILQLDQTAHEQLKSVDGTNIKDFEATDDQNGKYVMFFKSDTPWDSIFVLNEQPDGEKNKARLTLNVDKPPKKVYELNIKAYHNGLGSANNFVNKKITVKFIDKNELPKFNKLEDGVAFTEETMDERCAPFTAANDPKCDNDNHCGFVIHYHIMNTEEIVNFEIEVDDNEVPQVCLKRTLDREEQPYRFLTIIATNLETPPPFIPDGYVPLNLTITVIDINDNPPEFVLKLFKGGLADTDKIDSVVVTLNATDPDEIDQGNLWYQIVDGSIKVSDTSLDTVKNKMFYIENTTEYITNLLQPTQQMKGYFHFNVQVFDTLRFNDTAEVKIYIIADANRISFKFVEDIDTVKSKRNETETIFTNVFEYNCTIDDFAKKINESAKAVVRANEYTEVKTHFIDKNDDTVEKDVITEKLSDPPLMGKLRTRFEVIGLTLELVQGETDAPNNLQDLIDLLQILLIVVSVILGLLCVILIVAFILRTRNLQKRIEAMTTNVFGSTKSDLNRIGTSAPGTNRHAIEANPVWNEDLNSVHQYDTMSQASGGSDLIGIEDRADFEYDLRRASVNPIIHQRLSDENNEIRNQAGFNNVHKASRDNDDDDDISSLPDSFTNSKMF